MENFKNYYKFPLKSLIGCESLKVVTDDNHAAFDWCTELSNETRIHILNLINGKSGIKSLKTLYIKEKCTIYYGLFFDKPLLRIRGWGYLTGIGGLHLSENEAKAIQDEFGEYIVKILNK